jgi:hypothetical protein
MGNMTIAPDKGAESQRTHLENVYIKQEYITGLLVATK